MLRRQSIISHKERQTFVWKFLLVNLLIFKNDHLKSAESLYFVLRVIGENTRRSLLEEQGRSEGVSNPGRLTNQIAVVVEGVVDDWSSRNIEGGKQNS